MNGTTITTKLLKLAEICIEADTQIRTAINEATVAEYAERMADGDIFPNPHVYFDGVKYYLADGFHRFHAFGRNELTEARFEVHKGTAIDARRFALSANGSNGLRMTNEDKRKAVAWGLELYPNKSSRELAKICYVSHQFVENCRAQLSTVDSSLPRVGADGKSRKRPTSTDDTETYFGMMPTAPMVDVEDEPPRVTQDDSLLNATGISNERIAEIVSHSEPAVTLYYTELEQLWSVVKANATDKQLNSFSVFAAQLPALIKEEKRNRSTK